MTPPPGTLQYLSIGTTDFDRDCAYYAFGTRVAAFRMREGPRFLLADLDAAIAALEARG